MKSSKLCHNTAEVLDSCLTKRFPLLRSTATVELTAVLLIFVDQMGDFEWLTRRTKLPSSEIVRLDETGSETGFYLFATHTIVCSGILLYQMPMYHLPLDPSAAHAVKGQIINQLCYKILIQRLPWKVLLSFLVLVTFDLNVKFIILLFDQQTGPPCSLLSLEIPTLIEEKKKNYPPLSL